MSHAHHTSHPSALSCDCGAACKAVIQLQDMMHAHDNLGLSLREEIVLATILTNLGQLGTDIEARLTQWYKAVTDAETARANVALGTGMYLRPTTAKRMTVNAEERSLRRWLDSEQRAHEQRLVQVQRAIATHRAFLAKAVTQFQLQEGCLQRCLQEVEHGIAQRETRMEQLSRAFYGFQDLIMQWEQRWHQERGRLDFEIAQVPAAFQPGLQLGQRQRWSYVLAGGSKPVSQTQLSHQYALSVIERQLELSSQQSRLFFQTRHETWNLFLQQTATEMEMTVLTAQIERWHELYATLMQPDLDPTHLAPLNSLITAFFAV